MKTFTLKFYRRPDPLGTVGRYIDERLIDAENRQAAVLQAVTLRAEYPSDTAFVTLVEGDGDPFWSDELDHA